MKKTFSCFMTIIISGCMYASEPNNNKQMATKEEWESIKEMASKLDDVPRPQVIMTDLEIDPLSLYQRPRFLAIKAQIQWQYKRHETREE